MQEDENPKDRHGKLFSWEDGLLTVTQFIILTLKKISFPLTCIPDGIGNVRAARWRDKRVVGFNKDGEIIAMIRVGDCKSPTIPCFGGKNLTTTYIASATSERGGEAISSKLFQAWRPFQSRMWP
ncbi:hypothetical protein L204_103034 [Cryptococcus depauperatus]